jgi:hypothetical protein
LSANAVFVLTEERLREVLREVVLEERPVSANEAEPLLFTCSALCRKLGISRATVFRAREQGMPSVKVCDEYRYELEPCLAFFRGRSK